MLHVLSTNDFRWPQRYAWNIGMSTMIVDVDAFRAGAYKARMTPEQCRAARAWLTLSQDDLASAASVSNSTVRDFEAGRRVPIAATLAAMKAALEKQGVAFVDGGDAQGISVSKTAG